MGQLCMLDQAYIYYIILKYVNIRLMIPSLDSMDSCATPVIHVWYFWVYYICRNTGVLHGSRYICNTNVLHM